MNIICFADLHINHSPYHPDRKRKIQNILEIENPDLVLIAGDILEGHLLGINPYKCLSYYFDPLPVVCVPGNHEFFNHTIKEVQCKYENDYRPDKYNVHYLNVMNYYDIGYVHIFGDTLWYDGSISTVHNQDMYSFADGTWADIHIRNFNYIKEYKKCRERICNNQPQDWQSGILLTHHIPHRELNKHLSYIGSMFDAYSGVDNLLKDITAEYAVCGHTHKRICKTIENIHCICVGNDYHQLFYEVINI